MKVFCLREQATEPPPSDTSLQDGQDAATGRCEPGNRADKIAGTNTERHELQQYQAPSFQ